jgi:membrane protein involved in colicin uptake
MPKLANESNTEFLNRLCAMSEDTADEDLNDEDTTTRRNERKRRKEEQKKREEAKRIAKEEAARKAKQEQKKKEEAERKAVKERKLEEKRKKVEREAAKPKSGVSGSGGKGSQALGLGGKAKGKERLTWKASDIDEDEEASGKSEIASETIIAQEGHHRCHSKPPSI